MQAYSECLTRDSIRAIKADAKLNGYVQCGSTMSFERDTLESLEFVSYRTWIAELVKNTGILLVNLNYFDCSNSTIHQFSKWLNRHSLVDYHTIKQAARAERKQLDGMYIPEPTGEVYTDDAGRSFTFVW